MRVNDIRHLKVGDPLAVRFRFTLKNEFGHTRYEDRGGRWVEMTEDVWVPAYVLDAGPGSAYPESPVIEGATPQASGLIHAFHSGVVDSNSAEGIIRLPRPKS